MAASQIRDPGLPSPEPRASPRWPRVVGTIGVILGILIVIDEIDDLVMLLTWTEEDWRRIFGAEVAELIVRAMPPMGLQLVISAVEVGLGALLIAGSSGLLRRRRSSIGLCRLWAWLAIGWVILVTGWVFWWLQQYASALPGFFLVAWRAYSLLGVTVALLLLLAYPVFLLVWFSKPDVRAEFESWPG